MRKILILILLALPSICFSQVINITDPNMDFSKWKVKEFKGKADFKIVEQSKKMLKLTSQSSSFSLIKELHMDISEYPFINFEWKVETLPHQADVRFKDKDDQAAQIYVIAPSFPETINYKAIGYIWDTSAPPGEYKSPKFSNIKYIVLRNGASELNKIIKEKRNVYEDFKRLWGMELKKRKIVIALSIDSDDTRSTAISYFGDIYFSKE